MKAYVLLCAVVLVVASSAVVVAGEPAGPGEGRPMLNPFPEPEPDSPTILESIGGYFYHRFRDLTDILTIKLGWGTCRSLGFQARLCRPLQVGAGVFEGSVLAIDRGCVGVMQEAEIEGGISIFYASYLARKVIWQNGEAERRNMFFGDVGDKNELALDDLKMYDDGNQPWLTSTAQIQLPCLPKAELTVNWCEIPDFLLSWIPIKGLRVPPPFYKHDGPGTGEDVERIPAPSVLWHGQEEYETYE
ncbi:MAG: hypothetical protein R6V58_00010 [Planctomycetota bacterium]